MIKFLVLLYVPQIDEEFEIFIPSNKSVAGVINLLEEAVSDLIGEDFIADYQRYLYNKDTGEAYNLESFIHDLSITNGTKLLLS